MRDAAAFTGEFGMTNQQQGRDPNDKSTNVGQQQRGNMPNNPSDKGGQSGQHQQSHTGQGQQGQGQQGSGKGGQQQ
jgi:hypothetical protein